MELEKSEFIKTRTEATNWAAGCHASALLGLIIPYGNILGPLTVWLIKKDEIAAVMIEGKEALNFQMTGSLVLFALSLFWMTLIAVPVAFLSTSLIVSVSAYLPLILSGVKAYKTYNHQVFSYPPHFRFIK